MLQNPKKSAMRRAFPIIGYTGANGGGKSAAMVWDTLPSLAAGRPVLGTVRLLDYENPRECDSEECEANPFSGHYVRALPAPDVVASVFATVADPGERVRLMGELGEVTHRHGAAHPLWIALTDWQQVLDARGCDLLLDEVTGAASSRDSHALPSAIANKLVQLRRNDVVVRWSAPSWARADKIIRECSQAVVYCRGMLAKTVRDEGGARQWRNRRLFRWIMYDAQLFEDFTIGKRESLTSLAREWHWGPGSPAWTAYDTFDAVLTVGAVTESGRCYRCGGSRRAPACSCVDSSARVGGVPAARGPRSRGGAEGAPPPDVAPLRLADSPGDALHSSACSEERALSL